MNLGFIEDERNEFKLVLNEKLEKEVVGFLNANGGNLYIGVDDSGNIVGVDNVDDIQLQIKDRIKNNIMPITLGLFDIEVLNYDDKKYIRVGIAKGNEQPYYINKKGMTENGCYIRIGASAERMTKEQIENLYSKRTRNSLKNIISPIQDLTFSQLKIYYEEKKFTINDNFLKQLDLYTPEGKFNYVAYLLSDNNRISIKVATYSGTDAYDLDENEEYGFCCLIKATNRVIEKFEILNKTFAKITSLERKEKKMFDNIAIREAILNAMVHNQWQTENPPKFEIFSDHISITSTGGLPNGINKEEFLRGYSYPLHPELMRVFKDLDLVEQLGTGIIRILKVYDKECYEISENFIRVNFKYNDVNVLKEEKISNGNNVLSELQSEMLKIMKKNPTITQEELAQKFGVSRMSISRSIGELKEKQIVIREGSNKSGKWIILE